MTKNIIIIILSVLFVLTLFFLNSNQSVLRGERNLNDSLINKITFERAAKEIRLQNDSIKYVVKIDSLQNEITKINKLRINEHNKLTTKLAKIRVISTDSSFYAINDSIEKCCTMRYK